MQIRKQGIILAALASFGAAHAQDLPRAGTLGVAGQTTGSNGAVVERVSPSSTAQELGLQAGDVITKFGTAPVANFGEVVRAMADVRAGDTLNLVLRRDGREMTLRGTVKPRPVESYAGATVSYGAVAHNGGLLRDILVMPANKPDAPVVYLVQGYTCYSIEAGAPGGALYKELIAGLLARGIGFYRVEKAGQGDSRGGPSCAEGGFDDELSGFKTAYNSLITKRNIPSERIFMLGHSMGGVQAPLVAASSGANQPRGIAVFGTALRSWHDYMLQVVGVQSFYASGNDPAALETTLDAGRPALKAIFLDGKTVAEAAAISDASKAFLTDMMNWDGGPNLLFRNSIYWAQLGAHRMTAAWRDSKTNVLAMYGEADFAAIDPTDHQRIADIANHYRPGSGQFVMVPKTGHGMQIEGTRAQVRDAARSNTPPAAHLPYNPEITKILADWVDASLAKPRL